MLECDSLASRKLDAELAGGILRRERPERSKKKKKKEKKKKKDEEKDDKEESIAIPAYLSFSRYARLLTICIGSLSPARYQLMVFALARVVVKEITLSQIIPPVAS